MVTVEIFEPRYRDMTVLIARFNIPPACDMQVRIKYGARKGLYLVRNADIIASPLESMKTKRGGTIAVRAVPLDKLEKIE